MSNYLPHYTKKRQILSKKEKHLRRLIAQRSTTEKLLEVAKEVLQARIRVLTAEKATIPPDSDAQDDQAERIDARLSILQAKTETDILAEFGHVIQNEGV